MHMAALPPNPCAPRPPHIAPSPPCPKDPCVLEDVAEWSVADRQMRYGGNEMRVPVKGVGRLVFDEMWHPFYVFQGGVGCLGGEDLRLRSPAGVPACKPAERALSGLLQAPGERQC